MTPLLRVTSAKDQFAYHLHLQLMSHPEEVAIAQKALAQVSDLFARMKVRVVDGLVIFHCMD